MIVRAVLDANVIANIYVLDLLLRCAEVGSFTPIWSKEIEIEAYRALTERFVRPWPENKAAALLKSMNGTFPFSRQETQNEDDQTLSGVDPKDMHVASLAVLCQAEWIVTFNLKHFPQSAFSLCSTRVASPDDFALLLLQSPEASAWKVLQEMSVHRGIEKKHMIELLARYLPKFAATAAQNLG